MSRRLAITYPLGPGDRRLCWADGFLDDAQCARVNEELEFAHWRPSGVTRYRGALGFVTGRSTGRVSESAMEEWFTPQLQRAMRAIDRRVALLVPRFATRREPWQATRYARGGRFDYHCDAGAFAHDRAGEREHTVLLYLATPRRGGSTHFRALGVDVAAVAGRLVLWRNTTAARERDSDMIHAGRPLLAGPKTVLVTWVRQRQLRRGE